MLETKDAIVLGHDPYGSYRVGLSEKAWYILKVGPKGCQVG